MCIKEIILPCGVVLKIKHHKTAVVLIRGRPKVEISLSAETESRPKVT